MINLSNTTEARILELLGVENPNNFDMIVEAIGVERYVQSERERLDLENEVDEILNQMADRGMVEYDRYGRIILKSG